MKARHAAAFVAFFWLSRAPSGWLAATPVGAAEGSEPVAAHCPAYADHLRAAKAYLENADRGNATAELRLARDALRACAREDDEETALAAAEPSVTQI